MTRARVLAPLCLAAVLLAGCGGASASPSVKAVTVSADGGPSLTGKDVSISTFRGHPVVLVFWASWCGPCHDEQPELNAAYAKWKPRGVAFLGVDLRDDDRDALAFQRTLAVPYASVADTDATVAVDYRIPSAPALVFLDKGGKVSDTVLGALGTMSLTDFDAELTSLLAAPAPRAA